MDIERKLVSVRRVSNIRPIPGADNIVCLEIDGWELVSQKGNFQIGDLCAYFEIDSFLPVKPEYEFLRSRCYKSTESLGEGFRLKTIKLRGQISQGLAMPLVDVLAMDDPIVANPSAHDGFDLTELLGVQKYEQPVSHQRQGRPGVQGGPTFPVFIPKTDEERVQNCLTKIKNWIYYDNATTVVDPVDLPAVCFDLDGNIDPGYYPIDDFTSYGYSSTDELWYKNSRIENSDEVIKERSVFEQTVKLDGSSMTVYYNDGKLGVCSRNHDLDRDPHNQFWTMAHHSGLLAVLAQLGMNMAIQGEIMGPGIQGNRENFPEHRFYVFNIYNVDEKRYLSPSAREAMMSLFKLDNRYGIVDTLFHVPRLPDIEITRETSVYDLIALADATESVNHKQAEGIVFKSHVSSRSFKAISNKFLLSEKD